jgi:hypothetical protein
MLSNELLRERTTERISEDVDLSEPELPEQGINDVGKFVEPKLVGRQWGSAHPGRVEGNRFSRSQQLAQGMPQLDVRGDTVHEQKRWTSSFNGNPQPVRAGSHVTLVLQEGGLTRSAGGDPR